MVETLSRQYADLRRRLGQLLERLELTDAYRTVADILRLRPDDAEVLAVRAYLDEKKVPSPAQSDRATAAAAAARLSAAGRLARCPRPSREEAGQCSQGLCLARGRAYSGPG